jgi:hypothetical protein
MGVQIRGGGRRFGGTDEGEKVREERWPLVGVGAEKEECEGMRKLVSKNFESMSIACMDSKWMTHIGHQIQPNRRGTQTECTSRRLVVG